MHIKPTTTTTMREHLRFRLAIFKLCVYHKLKCATHFKDVWEPKLYSVSVQMLKDVCELYSVYLEIRSLQRHSSSNEAISVCPNPV